MRAVCELNSGGFGGFGGVIGECQVNRLRAGGACGWVLHRFEGFRESGVAEVGLTFVAIDTVEEGGDFKKLETRVHEVEILDFFLRRHIGR